MNVLKNLSFGRSREPQGPNPARDWYALVGAGLLLFFVSVLWNVWFFDSIVREGLQAPNVESAAVDTSKVAEIEALFAARATTSAAYRTLYPFVDPSR